MLHTFLSLSLCQLQIQPSRTVYSGWLCLACLPTWLSPTALVLLRPSASEGVQLCCCQPFPSASTTRSLPGFLALCLPHQVTPEMQSLSLCKAHPSCDGSLAPTGESPIALLTTWHTIAWPCLPLQTCLLHPPSSPEHSRNLLVPQIGQAILYLHVLFMLFHLPQVLFPSFYSQPTYSLRLK